MAAEDTAKNAADVVLEPAPASPEEPAPPARRRFDAATLWQTVGPLAVFIALFAVIAVLQPEFVGGGGLAILAVQATSVLLHQGPVARMGPVGPQAPNNGSPSSDHPAIRSLRR